MTAPKTSRRLFLAAGSATAVFGALATAASQEADPVFAAIERLKVAWAAYSDACAVDDDGLMFATMATWQEAEDALIATTPTTLAGIRAAIEYLVKYDSGCEPLVSGSFMPALLASPIFGGGA